MCHGSLCYTGGMIVGVDEVGRGCWAGPVAAGAVVLSKRMRGLKDSKLLTAPQRVALDAKIRVNALSFGIGWASVEEIDQLGMTEAVRLAMHRALDLITVEYDELVVDGNYNYFADNPKSRTLIDADNLIPEVSAASIIAKVARDAYMAEIAANFPQYGFERHVGYGTAAHRAALALHGVCELHRQSFKPIQALLV